MHAFFGLRVQMGWRSVLAIAVDKGRRAFLKIANVGQDGRRGYQTPLVTYWSGSPYWLGPPGTTGGRTVKYSFVPSFKGTAPHTGPKSNSERFLSLNEALRTTMVAIANMTTQRIIETLRTYLSRHLLLSAEIHGTYVAE
jgi:hypothetical protein